MLAAIERRGQTTIPQLSDELRLTLERAKELVDELHGRVLLSSAGDPRHTLSGGMTYWAHPRDWDQGIHVPL